MPALSVAIFASNNDQRAVLQVLVDGTSVARTVCAHATLPLAASDGVIHRTQSFSPDVILLDIPSDGISAAIALLAAVALFKFKRNVTHVIAGCAVLGYLAKAIFH